MRLEQGPQKDHLHVPHQNKPWLWLLEYLERHKSVIIESQKWWASTRGLCLDAKGNIEV